MNIKPAFANCIPRHITNLVLLLSALLLPMTASANYFKGFQAQPSSVAVKDLVEVIVTFDEIGQFACGMSLRWGDGKVQDLAVGKEGNPIKLQHRYTKPGWYKAEAKGKLIVIAGSTLPPCDNKRSMTQMIRVGDEGSEQLENTNSAKRQAPGTSTQQHQATMPGAPDPFKNYEKIAKSLKMTCYVKNGERQVYEWDGEHFSADGLPPTKPDGKELIKQDGKNVFLLNGEPIKMFVDFDRKQLTAVGYGMRNTANCL